MSKPRKLRERKVVIASHNQGKIAEIRALLAQAPLEILDAAQLALDEPEETGSSYLENALIKAKATAEATDLPAISDDSGIELAALNGQPGLNTAPYTRAHGGRQAVFAMWSANPDIEKNPRASFVSVVVLYWPDGHYEHFEGRVHGKLQFPPQGSRGHGYDPVFIPDGCSHTAAELTISEKNRYSHRADSINQMLKACLDFES